MSRDDEGMLLRPSRTAWGHVEDRLTGELLWNIEAEISKTKDGTSVIFFRQRIGSEEDWELIGDAKTLVTWLLGLGHCVHKDRRE